MPARRAQPPKRGASVLTSDPAFAVAALLAVAVVVGGGGVSAAFGNLAVQLIALAILAWHPSGVRAFVRDGPRSLVCLTLASCLLPVLQLVPMPPAWWQALPGRELVAESFDLAGGGGWFTLSVAPARTVVAVLGTLAPLAILILGSGLRPERLVMLQRVLADLAIAVALFGSTHLLDARWGDLYASRQALPGVLVGTFADRNAAAVFLLSGLLLLIGLPTPATDIRFRILRLAGALFLTLCIILTGSRTGIVLLAAPAALVAWRVVSSWNDRRRESALRTPGIVALSVAALLGATLAIGAVASTGRGQAILSRFDGDDGMRAEMREDARFAAARYWPAGAGMGTFDEVFQIDESLEYVSPRRAGRAHMDYLELAIEAGVAGLAIAAGWLLWAGWLGWQAVRRPHAWPARAAFLIVVVIAAQSLLSFPLRNQTMLCVAAMAVVILARSPVGAARTSSRQGETSA